MVCHCLWASQIVCFCWPQCLVQATMCLSCAELACQPLAHAQVIQWSFFRCLSITTLAATYTRFHRLLMTFQDACMHYVAFIWRHFFLATFAGYPSSLFGELLIDKIDSDCFFSGRVGLAIDPIIWLTDHSNINYASSWPFNLYTADLAYTWYYGTRAYYLCNLHYHCCGYPRCALHCWHGLDCKLIIYAGIASAMSQGFAW